MIDNDIENVLPNDNEQLGSNENRRYVMIQGTKSEAEMSVDSLVSTGVKETTNEFDNLRKHTSIASASESMVLTHVVIPHNIGIDGSMDSLATTSTSPSPITSATRNLISNEEPINLIDDDDEVERCWMAHALALGVYRISKIYFGCYEQKAVDLGQWVHVRIDGTVPGLLFNFGEDKQEKLQFCNIQSYQ